MGNRRDGGGGGDDDGDGGGDGGGGAGAGRCCRLAAWRGGAERGSVLGMRCLKSHRCQTAGQTLAWWPSERAAGLRHGGTMPVSPVAA